MKKVVLLLGLLLLIRAAAVASDFSEQTIYFILIDRFHRGESGAPPPAQISSPDHSEWKLYWGGDIKGVADKLPYIKSLGTTAIWLTPVFDNTRDLYRYKFGDQEEKISAYHGYWARDFTAVNPFFGILEDYRNLVNKAHGMGIKIIFDMVLNHTSPVGQGCDGALYDGERLLASYGKDPDNWFHHRGSIDFSKQDPGEWQDKNLFDLADLAQENPKVAEYLIQSGKFWVAQGIDGFRLDTVRHLPSAFVRRFVEEMLEINPNLWFFGEWSMGGLCSPEAVMFTNETGVNLIDFTLQSLLLEVIAKDKPCRLLPDYLKKDLLISHPERLVTIIDNHDMPRFISTCRQYGSDERLARKKTQAALLLLMCLRGIPCIYYGTEQFLHNDTPSTWGVGGEPYNRQMMERFDSGLPFITSIRKLAQLRRSNAALRKGLLRTLALTPDAWVFEKHAGKNAVLVAFNKGKKTSIEFLANPRWNGRIQGILGPPATFHQGKAVLDLPPWSCRVLALP
ncbi:MAG: alpha-amylase family glycosyl hydrolase [bacterium]